MNIAFRKVGRDLWNHKGRTLLVVLSIGVGVLALGMITASNTLLARQMTLAQAASRPTSLHLYLNGSVDAATVRSLARLPGLSGGVGLASFTIRWKSDPAAEWQDASLIALEDYTRQTQDLVTLQTGAWPGPRTAAVEFNHVAGFGAPAAGATVYFEVNERAKPFRISGTVRDPYQFPPPFSDRPAFYVTPATLAQIGLPTGFTQLRFAVTDYEPAAAQAQLEMLKDRLETSGVGVGLSETYDPDRHFLQDMMDGVGLVLLVMAVLSLGMSVFLVVNTLNALLAQQVPQIGIMKTVGGVRGQIAQLYLAGVLVYCLLSLMLAVPLGAWGADALTRWMLALLNVPAGPFELMPAALALQGLTGLLVPLLAALWPVLQGVAISVREALNAYGLGTGHYGSRWLDQLLGRIRGLPRAAALALRNTFRRPGRVALTQVTLISAGAIFMMVLSAQHSFNRTVQTIFSSFGYDVILGFEQLQRTDEIVPLLASRPNVARVESWTFYTAQARRPGASEPGAEHEVFLRGIPADTQLFTPELTAGRGLDPRDGHALLLNQKLARQMGLTVGDVVELDLGLSGQSAWTIVGLIFDLAGRDQNTAYLNRDTLNGELGWTGRTGVVEIRARDNSLAAQQALERDVRAFLAAQSITVSFSEVARAEQEQANAQFSVLTTVLLLMTGLIGAVGSIGLSGTLSINVLERRREIGVLRAVGASSADVAAVFMGEGLLLGLLSWLGAIPLSAVAGGAFVDVLGAAIDFPAVYHYASDGVWLWLAIVVALALLASWLPARRATQVSVRESLAYE